MEKAIHFLSKKDPHLAVVIDRLPPPKIEIPNDVFCDLVWCIVEQQIPYRARGTWMKKLFTLLDDHQLLPENILTLRIEDWQNEKLSAKKYQNLLTTAELWQQRKMHQIDWSILTDEEVQNTLIDLPGIGKQSVQMIQLYTLQRPDIFPADDYHLKLIMPKVYDLDPKKQLKKNMQEIAANWSPHRSLAVRYLLDYKLFMNKRK